MKTRFPRCVVSALAGFVVILTAATDLAAGTIAHWTFDGYSEGVAIDVVPGSGSDAFLWQQTTAAYQPHASTLMIPPVDYSVTTLSMSAHFTDAGTTNNDFMTGVTVQSVLNFSATAPFTIEAWFYLETLPGAGKQRAILSTRTSSSGNSGLSLAVLDTGKISFALDSGPTLKNLISTTVFSIGQWYHVAATRDATGKVSLYVNGALDAQSTGGGLALASDVAPLLGASPVTASSKWDGYIAEVRISDAALLPEAFLYTPGNVAEWEAQPTASTTYAKAVFRVDESPSLEVKVISLGGPLSQPSLSAEVYDFWGSLIGSALVQSSSTAGNFVIIPPAAPLGWYRIEMTLTDNGTPYVLRRKKIQTGATELYDYLPFAIVPVPATVAQVPESPFGVDAAASTAQGISVAAQAELAQLTGARWVRDRISWASTNPSSGQYSWTTYKNNVDALAARGLSVLEVFQSCPAWTRPTASESQSYPQDLQAAYQFALTAADALSPAVKAWEIWNEMDTSSFSVEPPDLLAATLKSMSLGFHDSIAKPVVLNGPFARDPRVEGYAAVLEGNELNRYLDAYSFHTYHPIDSTFDTILATHLSVSDQIGLEGKPIWLSETARAYALNSIPVPATAQEAQVRYLFGAYMRALQNGIRPIFWFILRPFYATGPTQFGLVDSQFAPFPVFAAYSVLCKQLGPAQYLGTLDWTGDGWVFSDGTRNVAVLVGSDGVDELYLPPLPSGSEIFDLMGNLLSIQTSSSGSYVSSRGYPIYVRAPAGTSLSLAAPAGQPRTATTTLFPQDRIVLRVNYPRDHISLDENAPETSWDGIATRWAPRGYHHAAGETITFTIDAYNFGSTARTGSLEINLPPGYSATPSTAVITIPAAGKVTTSYSVQTGSSADSPPGFWSVRGVIDGHAITPSTSLWTLTGSSQASSPLPPNGLTAMGGDAHVALNWSTVANALSYSVKRATASGGPYSLVATGIEANGSTASAVSYDDVTAANGADYYYIVTATNATGESYPSNEASATTSPLPANITLGNLNQVYDGAPKPVTATTVPENLDIIVTYAGDTTAPTAAGSYDVVAAINTPHYSGTASGTLIVAQAPATVTLGDLAQTYNGFPRAVTAMTNPSGLPVALSYDGSSTAPVSAGNYFVSGIIVAPNHSGAASGTLVVAKASAAISLASLAQPYDGSPKTVTAATVPPNLAVDLTYDGIADGPVYPGSHTVVATVNDTNYTGSLTETLAITTTALVRHAPFINGLVDGSVQVLGSESLSFNSSAALSGDLLLPGMPAIQLNGSPVLVGTVDATGSTSPANYSVTLNSGAVLRYLVRRVDPIVMPSVTAPSSPAGFRSVALNAPTDPTGDFSTLRDLTLNSNVGNIAVPPGTYGNFVANSGSAFVLGVAGATQPSIYQLQNLTLNSTTSEVQIIGPVILTVANGVTLNGVVGDHSEWLTLQIYAGGVTLNSGASISGTIIAPAGTVSINGNASVRGAVSADRLTVNSNGLLEEATP